MTNPTARVEKFSSDALRTWMTDEDGRVLFGDLVDESTGARLDVTFIRRAEGESYEFESLPYDEVFVVVKGSYTIRTADGDVTARVGEVIYLLAGAEGVYTADEDAELVAVTYPPYRKALREAGRGADLDALSSVQR